MDSTSKVLLIVDDSPLDRAVLSGIFSDLYEIREADNGKTALEILQKLEKGRIAMILLDVVMPVLDGMGLLKEMRRQELHLNVPVLLLTASPSPEIIRQGCEMGVHDILNKPFNRDIIRRRVENLIELQEYRLDLEKTVQRQTEKIELQAQKIRRTSHSIIDTLSTVVEFRDGESSQHIHRIRQIVYLLLEDISADPKVPYTFTQDQIDLICDASAMHDIGKIAIPDAVLIKPGKLTPEEFEIMKGHTLKGCSILEQLEAIHSEDYYRYCYDICRSHHERFDGKGYPDKLKGDEIPIWAQIVSMADVYDALVSPRVYKPAFTHKQAAEMILNGACGAFNPILIDSFLHIQDTLEHSYTEVNFPKPAKSETPFLRPQVQELKPSAFPGYTPQDEAMMTTARMYEILEQERNRYRTIIEAAGDIILEYNLENNTLTFSENFREIFHGSLVIPNANYFLMHSRYIREEDRHSLLKVILHCTDSRTTACIQLQLYLPTKKYEWFQLTATPLREGNFCRSIIGRLTNIQKLMANQERWRLRTTLDPLTMLYNQDEMCELCEETFQQRPQSLCALIYLDIDHFKAINDQFGHSFGDEVIKMFACRLKQSFRQTDLVARSGGDEFTILMLDLPSKEIVIEMLERLRENLDTPYHGQNLQGQLSVSIGISIFPDGGSSYRDLLHQAVEAMSTVKSLSGYRYAFYGQDGSGESV